MRLKPVPSTPPPTVDAIEGLATVRDALPLVPRSEDDCCARLVDRVEWIESREAATRWIAFLRALGLAERTGAGYTRVREEPDFAAIADRFRERILVAEAAIDALGTEPGSPDEISGAIADLVPEWERRRSDTWQAEWTARTERLLAWAALLGLADRVDGEYVRT